MTKKWHLSKKLNVVKNMPALFHRQPGEKFDVKKSEVIRWLSKQDDVMSWLFDYLSDEAKIIEYSEETGTWHGVKEVGGK